MSTIRITSVWGIVILLLLGWACSKAPMPTDGDQGNVDKPNNLSKIIVSTTDYQGEIVDSAQVYFDGEFIGYTPLTQENINLGTHSLRVQKSGYELYTERINFSSSQPVFIEAVLKKMIINKGQLLVTVDRDSVTTFLTDENNQLIDLFYSREKSFVLDPGGYFLKAEREGYRLFYVAVKVVVDSIVIQNIHLEKIADTELPDIVLAIPDSVPKDTPFIVSWESTNAERVDIDYIENPGLHGRRELSFQISGLKYINATAYNDFGSYTVNDSIVVYDPVEDPAVKPQIRLSVTPEKVKTGESATLRWRSTNATSVSVDYVPAAGLDGAWQVAFDVPGQYIIQAHAYGPGGSAGDEDTLIVEEDFNDPTIDPPVISAFTLSPDSIQQGETAVLHWEIAGENVTVFIDQGIGQVGMTGNQNVSPPVNTTFTLSATNSGGSVSRTVELKVRRTSDPTIDPPVIENFTLSPDSITNGETAVLHWQVSGENVTVFIDQGIGQVGEKGNQNVSPPVNTTFTLSATNPGGTVSKSVELKVGQTIDPTIDPPVIESFTVSPDSITEGETAVLQWLVSGENVTVYIDQGIGEVGATGNQNVSPQVNTVFTISAVNQAGSVNQSVMLKVGDQNIPDPDPPTITLNADPGVVSVNQEFNLSWVSTHATSVTVDYVPNAGVAGQYQLSFSESGQYVIRAIAYGEGGTAEAKDTVLVQDVNPPTLEFEVSPDNVNFGVPVHISWNSNGYQVVIDQGVGVRGPFGSEDIIFQNPGKKVFTATAYGENQKTTVVTDSVFVEEPEPPQLPTIFLATVDSVEVGEPALIEWHSENAQRVDVDFVQNPGLNGKAEVIFYSTGVRTINATAYNAAGQLTASENIVVVSSNVQPQVLPIYISSLTMVTAFHPNIPQFVENAGQTEIPYDGHYRVRAQIWYNSGDYQKNESFFIKITDQYGQEVYPQDANGGNYKVVPDDPGPPHVNSRDAGLFYLERGQITIGLYHYYTICEDYPQFVVDGPIDGPESVEVISFVLEYVEP